MTRIIEGPNHIRDGRRIIAFYSLNGNYTPIAIRYDYNYNLPFQKDSETGLVIGPPPKAWLKDDGKEFANAELAEYLEFP